jgi:hypothetical protein
MSPLPAEVAPEEWDSQLEALGYTDGYLLRHYVASSCVLYGGRPVFLRHEDTVFPLVLRDFGDRHDATSAYGYGGPVGGPDFYPAYDAWCRERGVLTTFVRFHPLFANQRYAPPAMHVEPRDDTIAWRLDRDLLGEMHQKHRNAVRKGQSSELEVRIETAPADLTEFASVYEQTMRRVDADDFYVFPAEYWPELARLGGRLARVDARIGTELAASALLLASPPWLHYHLSATTELGRETAAATLLIYEAALWARERGYTHFHLGGGAGGREDSLFRFKLRFSPEDRREAMVGKLVHDADAYRRLAGPAADDLSGFFPAYRS